MRPAGHNVAAFALLLPLAAAAQNVWQGEALGRAEARAKLAEAEKARAAAKLSSNRIVGRVLWTDPAKGLVVVRLDAAPTPPGAPLIARSADCTPHAILAPVPMRGRPSATVGYRVTHGTVSRDLEVVQPGEKLLGEARRKLPAVRPAPVSAPTAAKPAV